MDASEVRRYILASRRPAPLHPCVALLALCYGALFALALYHSWKAALHAF